MLGNVTDFDDLKHVRVISVVAAEHFESDDGSLFDFYCVNRLVEGDDFFHISYSIVIAFHSEFTNVYQCKLGSKAMRSA